MVSPSGAAHAPATSARRSPQRDRRPDCSRAVDAAAAAPWGDVTLSRGGRSRGMRTVFAALAASLLLAAPAAAQTTDTTPTIAADGRGTATLVPDIADFGAGVLRRAPTSAGARRSANARIAAIVKTAKAAGVADADIATTGLRIARERVGRRGHRRIRYAASQELRIRSRDVKALGALLDAVADAGADEVSDPEFGFA